MKTTMSYYTLVRMTLSKKKVLGIVALTCDLALESPAMEDHGLKVILS